MRTCEHEFVHAKTGVAPAHRGREEVEGSKEDTEGLGGAVEVGEASPSRILAAFAAKAANSAPQDTQPRGNQAQESAPVREVGRRGERRRRRSAWLDGGAP